MSRRVSMAQAYLAVANALKGINGAAGGYVHDLGGRVLDAWTDPEESPEIELPYLCLPLLEEDGRYEDMGGTLVGVTLGMTIIGYVAGVETSNVDDGNSVIVAHLHDDILRALMPAGEVPRWNAGSPAIKTLKPIARRLIPADRENKHGIVIATVDVTVHYDRNDLTA